MIADSAPHRASTRGVVRNWRRLAGNVSLALLACGMTLLAAEALIRLVGLAPPTGLFTVTDQEYARVPGIFSPNQSVTEGTGTRFAHATRIDSLGYRGADFPRRKADREFRILYAGDSFTYGHNVADHETLPAQLEQQLSTVCTKAQVINAGLSGSTIDGQDEMVLRGLTVAPDLVVLMYHENDIDELMGARIWSGLAENRRIKSRLPASLVYRFLRRSAIWNLALDARRAFLFQPVKSWARPSDQEAPVDAVEAAQREYIDRLSALADTLRELGTPLVFALFPHPESARAGQGGRDYERIRASAVQIGLPTVDFLATLHGAGVRVEDTFLLPEDYHPSARGYRIAATALSEAVLPFAPRASCRP